MEPSRTSEIQKNRRYYNHDGWKILYWYKKQAQYENKHENKQSSFHKEDKDNVLVTLYTFILKALSNFSFPRLKEVLKTNFPKAKRKLLSIGQKAILITHKGGMV